MNELLERAVKIVENNARHYEVIGNVIEIGMPATVALGFDLENSEETAKAYLARNIIFFNFTKADLSKVGLMEQQVYIRSYQPSEQIEKKLFDKRKTKVIQ